MKQDCIFLLADGQMEQTFKGFLRRDGFNTSLKIRPFTHAIKTPDRRYGDSGIRYHAHEFLRLFVRTHQHAIVVLDHRFEGAEKPEIIRNKMKKELVQNGWREEDVEVVVIVPELEVWLCQNSQHVVDAFHFDCTPHASLRAWLEAENFWHPTQPKPSHPKAAFEKMKSISKAKRSAATYAKIASNLSVKGCTDPAFCLLHETLRRWFPADGGQS